MIDYRDKRVLVTGAASGMGEATARLLSEFGATVIGLDVRPVSAPVERALEVDLADPSAIDRALVSIEGPIHALFNCAGVPGPPLSNLQTLLVNFIGPRHLTEAVALRMPEGGAIASVSSLAGMGYGRNLGNVMQLLATRDFAEARTWCEAHPDIADGYKFSKECLIAYTMMRARELGRRGIRINCISPGITETPMLPHFHKLVGKDWMETHLQGFLGRNARPDEQARPLVFLNSDAASFISGANLFVDAGYAGALSTGQVEPPPARPRSDASTAGEGGAS